MSERIQRIMSFAVGMDTTEFMRRLSAMYMQLGKARAAMRPLSDSFAVLDEALAHHAQSAKVVEIVTNRMILAHEKNADRIRKEAAAVRELRNAEARERGLKIQADIQAERDAVEAARKALERRLETYKKDKAAKEASAAAARKLAEAEAAATLKANSFASGKDAWKGGLKQAADSAGFRNSGASAWAAGLANQTQQLEAARRNSMLGVMLSGSSGGSGANAWSAGAAQAAATYREAAAGANAWANGLRQITVQAEAARAAAANAGAEAWAAGLANVRQPGNSWTAGLNTLNQQRRDRSDAALEENIAAYQRYRETLDRGRQYMVQFENSHQRFNRQVREAYGLYREGAISANQYAQATRAIALQNNFAYQTFVQLRTAVTTLLGPLVLVYTGFQTFVKSIRLSAELDEATAKFRTFTGSLQESQRVLSDIRRLSDQSPVSFGGGQRAVTTLLQYGVEAKNVTRTLRVLAEITGGNTERMESLALAYAQANAAGRLMGQELLQMVNAGFNPLKVISEQTGKSMADLKAEMQDGQISFKMVEKAFLDATREGGKFNGLLDEIAGTTAGKLVRFQSASEKAMTAFGQLIDPATNISLSLTADRLEEVAYWLEKISNFKLDKEGSIFSDLAALGMSNPLGDLGKLNAAGTDKNKTAADNVADQMRAIIQSSQTGIGRFTISQRDVDLAKDYLKNWEQIKNAVEDGDLSRLTEQQRKVAEGYKDQLKELARNTDKGYSQKQLDKDIEAHNKAMAAAKTRAEREQLIIDLVEKHGQARFKEFEGFLEQYDKAIAAQEKLNAAQKEQERIQKAFKEAQDDAKSSFIDATYGDNAGNVKTILDAASVDTGERKKLDALIAQGAAYRDIVAAANAESQAQVKNLEALQAKTKAAEDAAKKQKEHQAESDKNRKKEEDKVKNRAFNIVTDTNALIDSSNSRAMTNKFGKRDGSILGKVYNESSFDERGRIATMIAGGKSFAEIMASLDEETRKAATAFTKAFDWNEKTLAAEKYKEKIEELKKKAKELEDSQKPNAEFVNAMADLEVLKQKGGLSDSAYQAERTRLLSENVKNVNASAAPSFGRGSQEAYKFASGQGVDAVTRQLKQQEQQTLLQQSLVAIGEKTNEKLDELNDNKPKVGSP